MPATDRHRSPLRGGAALWALLALAGLLAAGCSFGRKDPSRFEHDTTRRTLYLTAVTNGIIHIQYTRPGQPPHTDRGWVTPAFQGKGEGRFTVKEQDDHYELSTGTLRIIVRYQDAGVEIQDASGRPLSEDMRIPSQGSRVEVRKKLHLAESFYGGGLHLGPLNKLGQRIEMWNSDPLADGNYALDEDAMHQSHPFLITMRDSIANGLLLNSTFRSTIDVGYTSPDELRLSADGGTMDYYFVYGPTMADVLASLRKLTGSPVMPPLWALGLNVVVPPFENSEQLLGFAERMRDGGMPADVLWIGHGARKFERQFTWDTDRFGNPVTLLGQLHGMHFRVLTELTPAIRYAPESDYKPFDSGVRGDHFITLPNGRYFVGKSLGSDMVFPDLTSPEVRKWWAGVTESWARSGVDGVWITRSEPVVDEPETGIPQDARYNGEGVRTDHKEVHNVYPNLLAESVHQGFEQASPGKRSLIVSRAGFLGIFRDAGLWTGEVPSTWAHLREVPSTLLSLSLSGNGLVGATLGGATRINDPELFVRWVELASWMPLLRQATQGTIETYPPYSLGPRVESIMKHTLDTRYRMTPYWYSLMHQYVRNGSPPIRPLIFDDAYTTDANVRNMSDEWLVGKNLLVAPVIERGTRTRTVYLPKGRWTEQATDRIYRGPVRVTVNAPLESVPTFAREGAIFTSWPLQTDLAGIRADTLIVDLYTPDRSHENSFLHTTDDGVSTGGSMSLTTFTLSHPKSGEIRLGLDRHDIGDFHPLETHLLLRFHHIDSEPRRVLITTGGNAQTELLRGEGRTLPFGWTFHKGSHIVEVLVPQQDAEMNVLLQL